MSSDPASGMLADIQREVAGVEKLDPTVLEVMRRVPRETFVPPEMRPYAYEDRPLPIGHNQTISQPYIVALMTHLLRPRPAQRILEVGTGSGYQAAVLAGLVDRVYSIDRVPALAQTAGAVLDELGYRNIEHAVGNGYTGWPEHAPYDGIIVTAAASHVPPGPVGAARARRPTRDPGRATLRAPGTVGHREGPGGQAPDPGCAAGRFRPHAGGRAGR